MKNKISDLRNHMFAALERLSDENLNEEQIALEVSRSKSISDIGKVIVESAKTEILYAKMTGKKFTAEEFMDEQITTAASIEPARLERPPAVYNNPDHQAKVVELSADVVVEDEQGAKKKTATKKS